MAPELTLTCAQLNPTVGAIAANIAKIRDSYARHAGTSDLIVMTENVVTGYPAEDLVLKPAFVDAAMEAVIGLAKDVGEAGLLVSAPWREEGRVHNAALLLYRGEVVAKRFKRHLPNYGVFDEARVFAPGPVPEPVAFKGFSLGVMTCEDMWFPDVTAHLKERGAEVLIVPNGSPFELGKTHVRLDRARARIAESGLPLIYANQVGGQDELVFDGASFALDAAGRVLTQLPSYVEYESTLVWRKGDRGLTCIAFEAPHDLPGDEEEIYRTLVLGLRDYVDKNGFPGVLLGMSGGIDSALTAAIAVDALGADRVRGFMMPSPYTSHESLEDAAVCSKNLGIAHDSVSIESAMTAFDGMLQHAKTSNTGVTAENIQARARGLFLMAVSNATGYMVLSTGNKSEMSVGYATLYGDMCGGYNALKDVYKTTVFALARWRNRQGAVIPERIITRPPSAELRPDQKDEDSLPPYAVLDDILRGLVEDELDVAALVARGHDAAMVARVRGMLDRAEYKRRQACPGVKITSKAFGRDRRYPITNGFRG